MVRKGDAMRNVQHARYSGRAVVAARAAGFWRRAVALVIDYGITTGLSIVLIRMLDGAQQNSSLALLVFIAINAAYWAWGFGDGQTLGCMLTGMRIVTDRTGLEPGYRKGLARWVGSLISAAVFGFGYLWMLVDHKHQTWHDKLAGTVVIIDDGEPGPFWQ